MTFLMDKYITLFISENLNMSKVLRSLLHIHKMQEVHLKFLLILLGIQPKNFIEDYLA